MSLGLSAGGSKAGKPGSVSTLKPGSLRRCESSALANRAEKSSRWRISMDCSSSSSPRTAYPVPCPPAMRRFLTLYSCTFLRQIRARVSMSFACILIFIRDGLPTPHCARNRKTLPLERPNPLPALTTAASPHLRPELTAWRELQAFSLIEGLL